MFGLLYFTNSRMNHSKFLLGGYMGIMENDVKFETPSPQGNSRTDAAETNDTEHLPRNPSHGSNRQGEG